jgi:hypothetical protein
MKGKKTGGRKRGTPNKRTLRTIAVADEAIATGRPPLKIMIEISGRWPTTRQRTRRRIVTIG